ncbi:MAG: HAMP domain-containing sensor histidine kinase [Hyphomicrobiales bacterium]
MILIASELNSACLPFSAFLDSLFFITSGDTHFRNNMKMYLRISRHRRIDFRRPQREAIFKRINRKYIVFSYFYLLYCLPFFFCFMFLHNVESSAWIGSMICAIMYLAFVVDAANLAIMFLLGGGGAALAFLATATPPINTQAILEALPVVAFALFGGVATKYAEERSIAANRDRAMALAHSIAHELRTPLFGLKLELDALNTDMARGLEEGEETIERRELVPVLHRIRRHTSKAANIVELLLHNARDEEIDNRSFSMHDMATTVGDALARYPLSDAERKRISLRVVSDFRYYGSDLLMANVIANLIGNALRATNQNGGPISIEIDGSEAAPMVRVRDGGTGIARHDLKKVFDRFYSGREGGAGLGLAFCKRVITSFGGSITCRSEPGLFTEFLIRLPKAEFHK